MRFFKLVFKKRDGKIIISPLLSVAGTKLCGKVYVWLNDTLEENEEKDGDKIISFGKNVIFEILNKNTSRNFTRNSSSVRRMDLFDGRLGIWENIGKWENIFGRVDGFDEEEYFQNNIEVKSFVG